MPPTALIDAYLDGPRQLRDAIAGMTPEQIDAAPVPGKWSTRQVICHIADFEPVYADRMKRVIAEEGPTMFGGDPDLFAARLAYDRRDIDEELAMIEAVRRHVARILRTQPAEAFDRTGNHSEHGPMSLRKLLETITGHIPHHVRFIEEKRRLL
ncbi:MAG: DinB family protein [Planctomycetaceae bacterium]